jgi:hypothetical protein
MGVRGDGEVKELSKMHDCQRGIGSIATRLFTVAAMVLMVVAGILAPLQSAHADSTTYATSKRQFKVGILLIESTATNYNTSPPSQYSGGAENPDPFVFYIADARTDVKPQNWDLINPLAPSTVTSDIKQRWTDRNSGQVPFQLGQKITKDMAPYWEVSLNSTSLADLLQYDLLFITNHRDVSFTPAEREKLRKLVDGGGIVWIEDCGNMRIRPGGTFFLEELQFRQAGNQNNAGPVINQADHPILNAPYKLTFQEIANLGDKNYSNFYIGKMGTTGAPGVANEPVDANGSPLRGTDAQNGVPNSNTLVNVVGNQAANNQPYIAAGTYGSGAVIATAGDSGCDINDYAGGVSNSIGSGGNSGAICGKNIITAHTEDLKFLYNMIAWGSSSTTFRRSPRRTAASFDNVGAPLVESFSLLPTTVAATDIVASNSAPLIVNGVLYITGRVGGQFVLAAYDANPGNDLDGDGNPDDGVADLSTGKPFDLLWVAGLGGVSGTIQPSAPVYGIVNIPDPVNPGRKIPVATVFVTMPDGSLVGYQALPYLAGRISGTAVQRVSSPANPAVGGTLYAAPTGTAGQELNPDLFSAPAPVFFENKVFVTQPDGSVRCVDPTGASGTIYQTFSAQITKPVTRTFRASASATAGYVAQRNTTAFSRASNGNTNDLMLYQPVLEPTPASNTGPAGDILAYWLGTRNEVIRNGDNNGLFKTRVAGNLNLVPATTQGPPATFDTFRVVNGYNGALNSDLFIMPRVRIFAAERALDENGVEYIKTSAEQMLAEGRESTDFGIDTSFSSPTQPITAEGQIKIVKTNTSSLSRLNDVLLSVDYDVTYNDPANGFSNARPNKPLTVENLAQSNNNIPYPISTAAMTPDDLLLYGFTQAQTGGGSFLSTMVGTNEQEGPANTTRQRLRLTMHQGYDSVSIGNTTVSDVPVFRNRLRFPVGWPDAPAQLQVNTVEGITDVRLIGSPISTSSGIAYQLARGTSPSNGPVTLLMAIKTSQDVVLTLPEAYSQGQPVTVQQYNLLDASGSTTPQPVQNQVGRAGLDGDPARGRITITNFQTTGGTGFSATQSFVVTYTPAGTTTPKSVVLSPTPNVVGAAETADGTNLGVDPTTTTTQRVASSGFTPIQWYYVLPGLPLSSPTLNGNVLYFMQQRSGNSYIVAADANPAANDPRVRVGSGEQIIGIYDDNANVNHIRWANVPVSATGAVAPPVGGQGVLAMTGDDGLRVYQNAITLMTDSKRVIEVDGAGAALWSVDATFRADTIGGELPIYSGAAGGNPINFPNDTGRTAIQRKGFSQPSVAKRLASADYLVADTGNNRVLRMDRSGKLIWNMSETNDPFGIMAVGEPKTLSAPTDIQVYVLNTLLDPTNFSSRVIGYEVHYLIADSGNSRIIEVADYFDTQGKVRTDLQANGTFSEVANSGVIPRAEHIVVFTTRTGSAQGRSLSFQSVQRIAPLGPGGTPTQPVLVAVVGNTSVAGPNTVASADFGGGSLVQVEYMPFRVPLFAGVAPSVTAWTNPTKIGPGIEPANNGTVGQAFNQITIIKGGVESTIRITRPTSFQEVTIRDPAGSGGYVNVYYLCDASGVYGLLYDVPTANRPARLRAYWAFGQNEYRRLADSTGTQRFLLFTQAGIPEVQMPKFVPTSVQRLANGDFLITNGFNGSSPLFKNGQFFGEAFQVKPLVGFTGGDTLIGGTYTGFSAPRLITEGVLTSTRYRQIMGTSDGNTTLLEQPRSSSRQ